MQVEINVKDILQQAEGKIQTLDGAMVAPFIPVAAFQSLSGAGAVNVTSYHTRVATTGANAFTLANGTKQGQLKKITMVADDGDGTLTPTSLSGYSTITLTKSGEFVVLIWSGSAWVVLENSGCTLA